MCQKETSEQVVLANLRFKGSYNASGSDSITLAFVPSHIYNAARGAEILAIHSSNKYWGFLRPSTFRNNLQYPTTYELQR